MADDSSGHEAPTRRDYMKYGGAVVGGSLLAGCAGDGDSTPEATNTETATSQTTTQSEPSEVCMEPSGCVSFEGPPERAAVFGQTEADMLYALGELDRVVFSASIAPGDYYTAYYDALPETPFDIGEVVTPAEKGYDKELFYEADSDIHLMDPTALKHINEPNNFDDADVTEIEDKIGPFLGNYGRRPREWRPYRFYDLYEHFEIYAKLFGKADRARRLSALYNDVRSTIRDQLPPESERPTIALFGARDETVFYTDPLHQGYEAKQYRDLGVQDAFAGKHANDDWLSTTDFEGLLEVDPDVLIQMNALAFFPTEDVFQSQVVDPLHEHPVASELRAVKTDRIYPGGVFVQGPVSYLFQLEMLAKQLHPKAYGAWPGIGSPIPEEEQLFDRQRVADIINGDF